MNIMKPKADLTDSTCPPAIARTPEELLESMTGMFLPPSAMGEVNGLKILCLQRENTALKAEVERLKTLMHQTIWFVDDMIKTHTNGCEHCIKKQGAMIALFKDITIEPQWPIDPTAK